ncbi:MAG: hypothetical protein ABIO60_02340 [Aquaticitalea sp.]
MKLFFFTLFCGMALTFSSCNKDDSNGNGDGANNVAGYLYTSTNGEGMNQVVRFDRMDDGSLTNETTFSTNSLGGANRAAGGDAHGDYDFQGSIKIIGDYLLNVNAGGSTISVFSLDRTNGDLTLINNVNSGGTRPVSITCTPVAGSTSDFWLMVGNQWNNPNVQKDVPNVERYPNDAFYMMDLSQPDASDAERNIALFKFNSSNGNLTLQGVMDTYVRENGGPSQALFSEDGTKLAVSLWGIAHFGTTSPSLDEQHASRVYMYDFANGTISNPRFFEEEGISGTIGIAWAPSSNNLLYATNFNTTVAKTNNSLTVLSDSGSAVTKINNFTTGDENDLDEACWTAVSPSGDRLYVASFTGNVITPYTIGSNGDITGKLPFEQRGDFAPAGDSKDLYITSDNKYLYNTGALQSFSINIFDITAGGVNYRKQVTLQTTQGSVGTLGAFDFMGLTGFDL